MPLLEEKLLGFKNDQKVFSKGALSLVLVITRASKHLVFPIRETEFITEKEGQVKGLGKSAVQSILSDYGIIKTLAEEGGRTSRGSLGLMRVYVDFLNSNFEKENMNDIEKWWIEQVKSYFCGKPFKLSVDKSKSISYSIKMLIKQAEVRQKENTGTKYVGAVIQHLVGAKLMIALKKDDIKCYGFSVADEMNNRNGDYLIGESVIHVTTNPQEALIRKCQRNIEGAFRPIIITGENGYTVGKSLLETYELSERVEMYEVSQFISINVNELGEFNSAKSKSSLEEIIEKYNLIVDKNETDPSLKIDMQ